MSSPRSRHSPPSLPTTRLFSLERVTTLFFSVLAALCSGTNYVYSAYGPQLGVRLGLTHTQQNLVGLGGNAGSYGTGPFHGKLVDARGPKPSLVMAFFSLLIGYMGIKAIFDTGLKDGKEQASTATVVLLVFCGFLTGSGGSGATSGSLNTVAKSFPERLRTSFTALVLSGFGLSAFLFSTIAHAVFPGNTSDFLLVLAVGTSLPMILGWLFIRPIPLPTSSNTNAGNDGRASRTATWGSYLERGDDSDTHLLPDNELDYDESYVRPSRHARAVSIGSCAEVIGVPHPESELPDISGRELLMNRDFLLLFVILALLSGVGLMWINNVGLVAQSLYAKNTPVYDEVESFKFQTLQVSAVSVMNCAGRITIGIFTDFVKNRLGLRRAYCISLVAVFFFASQLVAMSIVDVKDLWKASLLVGFSYGSAFGLFPAIIIDWFGMAHFSENWGLVSFSPLVGGNIFSMAFGKNLDGHASDDSKLPPTTSPDTTIHAQCMEGVECYIWSLKLTTWACVLAFGLAVWAGYKDWKKSEKEEKTSGYRPVFGDDS